MRMDPGGATTMTRVMAMGMGRAGMVGVEGGGHEDERALRAGAVLPGDGG